MIRLVKPSIKYEKSYLQAREEEEKGTAKKLALTFSKWLRTLHDHEHGINLLKGRVPNTAYWLVDGKHFIGETSVRHRLTAKTKKEGGHIGYKVRFSKRRMGYGTKILELALKKAKKLGIKKALVTCNDDNVGSWRVIESNGGILQNKIKYQGKLIRRYWIKIK